MVLAEFQALTTGVLSVFGEDALLRGAVKCKINVRHGVEMIGAVSRDDAPVRVSVASMDVSAAPDYGDTFQFIDKATQVPAGPVYRLDQLIRHEGILVKWVVVEQ